MSTDAEQRAADAPPLGSRGLAASLSVLLLGSILLGAVLWAVGVGRPATEPLPQSDGGQDVVVVALPGLTWTDAVDRAMPALTAEATAGAIGAQSVRGAGPRACSTDGWLSLGAGRSAGLFREETGCPAVEDDLPVLLQADDGTARIQDWARWQEAADASSLDPRLGLLADTLAANGSCVSATDPLSALGAADSDGVVRMDDPDCRVRLVDAGRELAAAGQTRSIVSLDAVLAEQRAQNPDAAVLVTGLADDDSPIGLRVATLAGPGVPGGELRSGTTRQVPIVQTSDLTATILSLAGVREIPAEVSGQPLTVVPGDTEDAATRRAGAEAQSAAAGAAQDGTLTALGWTYGLGLALTIPLGVLAVRPGRHRGRARRALHTVALVAAAIPVASMLQRWANFWSVVPREDSGVVGAVTLGGIAVLVAAAASLAPGRRTVLGPLATVFALTVAVICVDVMTGSGLQLASYFGLQAIVGGRYYGVGNPVFGLLATAALLAIAAVLAVRARPARSSALYVLLVGLAVGVVGVAPMWGADFGGLPALLPALGVLAASVSGVRMSWPRALALGVGTVLALAAVCVADWLRPPESRSHLGAFVQTVLDGEAWGIVVRKLEQNWAVLTGAPLAFLVPLALLVVLVGVFRPDTRLGRVVHGPVRDLALPSALPLTLVVLWVLGFAVNDTGAAVVATGLALTVPAWIGWSARARPVSDPGPAR